MSTILLVEDDELTRESMRSMLASAGHTVRLASDGPAGILMQQAKPCDVVIMDVYMPTVEGLEAVATLRRSSNRVRILAVSMMNDGGKRLALALQLGADGVLEKPFKLPQLLRAVNELCRPTTPPTETPPQHRAGTE